MRPGTILDYTSGETNNQLTQEDTMKKHSIITLAAALIAAAAFMIGGCSTDSKEADASIANQIVDSVAASISDSFSRARLVSSDTSADPEGDRDSNTGVFNFSDMVLVDSTVYAVAGDQLIICNLADRSRLSVPAGQPVEAIAYHEGKVFVGGESLFEVIDSTLEPLEFEFSGTITELYSHGYRLIIGTTHGLYAKSIFGREALFDGIAVTALAEDNSGLWIGTDGQGLYRWDEREFKRRYLVRDTAIFDFVKALDFNHNHLYVGTSEALYIYDGGCWETVTTENGLPSNDIRSIDASNWVVYLATAGGVSSYFNGDVMPVRKVGDVRASVVRTLGRKIILGTAGKGLLMKSGPVVTTLVEPSGSEPDEPVIVSMQ